MTTPGLWATTPATSSVSTGSPLGVWLNVMEGIMADIHEGGCVCGAVRYKTSGLPKRVSACACIWCQKRTGSAFGLSVYFDESDVEFLQGSL